MKKSKLLTIYVILFMIASFTTGFLLLYTALLLQWSQNPQQEQEGVSSPLDLYLASFQESSSRSLQIQLQDQSLSFIQDEVCGGCRPTPVDPQTTCGSLLDESKLLHSARVVASKNECRHCLGCRLASKRYWRYDRVWRQHRQIDHKKSALSIQTFPPLSSVPVQHRVSKEALQSKNLTSYLLQQQQQQHSKQHEEYYFEYNPSIVLLPEAMRARTRESDRSAAVYLATFRVSNLNYCFRPTDRKLLQNNNSVKAKDWLGLAVLNHELEVLENVVLDFKHVFSAAQDCRLFLLNNQLYISSYDLIAPIWIASKDKGSNFPPPPPSTKSVKIVPVPQVFASSNMNDPNNNLQDNNLQVFIRSFASCAPCDKPRGFCGKNFNYFVARDKSSGDGTSSSSSDVANIGAVFVEIWPSPPHTARPIDLDQPCDRGAKAVPAIVDQAPPPKASYATIEEIYFYRQNQQQNLQPQQQAMHSSSLTLLTRGRGGACCLEMKHPRLRTPLLVGIQHAKTPSQGSLRMMHLNVTENHYLSQWYAFEPTPPFRIVARSGYFCLGFPTADNNNSSNDSSRSESSHSSSYLLEATRWRSLVLGERIEACPRIHFASGLTYAEAAAAGADGTNASSTSSKEILITYGINDCVSAVARVSVQRVQQLLFLGATNA